MILKHFELNKIDTRRNNLILFYGQNEGLKHENTEKLFKHKKNILKYDEKEIITNKENFFENLLSQSFFENEKNIIIKRSTDKIVEIIKEIDQKNLENTVILINAENLDKKSKLRSFFEKHKYLVCVAFYPDNEQALSNIVHTFLKEKKISISQANINILVNKCNGDRGNLRNELNKIENFCKRGKKLNNENIYKLINLVENYSISELVDNCLAKNEKKTINILNENNFSNDDCIIIIKSFLNKSKKILGLLKEYQNNNNINLTISSAKPPIFWKDKEITKVQILKWNSKKIRKLIYKLNELEFLIKKNIIDPVQLVTDFILYNSTDKSNS